jgi:L-threonylcarbamoyladenylate synthase
VNKAVVAAGPAAIRDAAAILRRGGVVAFPTETVYGLGADATQGEAVARVFEIKGRPAFNPLIVHIADPSWAARFVVIDPRFEMLAAAFWPGPLSIIMRGRGDSPISALAAAGLDTIALRCPAGPVAAALLRAADRPLAAPSANRSGGISPTTAAHVAASLGGAVDMILDGGPCTVGLESTVLDLTAPTPAVLRPGAITPEDLAGVIGTVVAGTETPDAPKSPGQLLRHYAPNVPVRLNATAADAGEALLGFGATPGATLNLSASGDLREAAANLFAMLHSLDDPTRFKAIAVVSIPERGLGVALNDRLRRAATREA